MFSPQNFFLDKNIFFVLKMCKGVFLLFCLLKIPLIKNKVFRPTYLDSFYHVSIKNNFFGPNDDEMHFLSTYKIQQRNHKGTLTGTHDSSITSLSLRRGSWAWGTVVLRRRVCAGSSPCPSSLFTGHWTSGPRRPCSETSVNWNDKTVLIRYFS